MMTTEPIIIPTSEYRPGFRKARLWDDRLCRLSILIIAALSAITVAGALIFPSKYRMAIELTALFCGVIPAAMSLAGGLPANCRGLYLLFAGLYEAALIPAIAANDYSTLFLMVPALIVFCVINRRAPWIMKNFGYTGKRFSFLEIPAVAAPSAYLVWMLFFTFSSVEKLDANLALPVSVYLTQFFHGLAFYAVAFALMYGFLAERALNLRYSIFSVIILNIFLHFILVLPMSIGIDRTFTHWISGEAASAVSTQFFMGMTYYYFRTCRPGLSLYLIYMVFYNVIFLLR